MNYTNQKRINTTESIFFESNLGDLCLENIATTGNVMVGHGTNLILSESIFCKNLSALGKVKAQSIVCAESCVALEYDCEYISAFHINNQIIERNVTPSSSPLFVSVEEACQKEKGWRL